MELSYSRSITVDFIRPLQRSAQRLGLPFEPLLRESGIGAQVLDNDRARVSPQQYARLLRAFWQASGDETFGMSGSISRYGVFALVAKQLLQCQTLGQVLEKASYYCSLVTDAYRLRFEPLVSDIGPKRSRISITLLNPDYDPDYLLIEFLLLVWHRFPSWMIGERVGLERVTLAHPEPAHAAEYSLLFPCPYACGQPLNSIEFDATWLEKPVLATPHTLRLHLARAPLDWFIRQPVYPRMTSQVMGSLEQASLDQLPDIEAVAQQLNTSVRTLRRNLEQEGSRFQQLKDDLRRDKAIQLLDNQRRSVAEVGLRLGYREPAAFINAFKRWTGLSPGVYRKQLK